jgi:hypothetical protein
VCGGKSETWREGGRERDREDGDEAAVEARAREGDRGKNASERERAGAHMHQNVVDLPRVHLHVKYIKTGN